MVFDSTTSFYGKCLNDALLTGPVLQTQLPKILIKFREGQVASKRCSVGSASPPKTPASTDSCGRSPVATRSKCCKWIASPSVTSAPRTLPSASSSVSFKSSRKTVQKRRMPSDTTSTSTTISTTPAPRRRQYDVQRTSGRYLQLTISTSEIGCPTRRSS